MNLWEVAEDPADSCNLQRHWVAYWSWGADEAIEYWTYPDPGYLSSTSCQARRKDLYHSPLSGEPHAECRNDVLRDIGWRVGDCDACCVSCERFSFEGYHSDFRPEQIEALAAELDIDFERDYRLERELLELAPKAKLEAWAKEWKHGVYASKRADIINDLASECIGNAAAPKELVTLKPVQL